MLYGRLICCLAAVMLAVAGCTPGESPLTEITSMSQSGSIGPDDGSDSCYQEASALYKTGDFFGPSIMKGAVAGAAAGGLVGLFTGANAGTEAKEILGGAFVGAAGGYWAALQAQHQNDAALEATVSNDLTTENEQIDDTQIAFNNDMDCRFQQAQSIKAAYASGQLQHDQAEAQMSAVRDWANRDVKLAQKISAGINSRSSQFDTAATNLGQPPPPPPPPLDNPAVARREVVILLRPDPAAPTVGQLSKRENVTVTGSSENYALVQADDGSTGYVPLADLSAPGSYHPIHIHHTYRHAGSTQVAQLTGSNAARGDDYAQSVAVTQTAVAGSGFQLSS